MPQPTAKYPFEHRLARWADALALGLTGRPNALFVGFRPDGTVRRVYFSAPGAALDGARKSALADAYRSWFLYSPYEDAEGAYLEWLGLPASVVTTWTGVAPTGPELVPSRGDQALAEWPEAWRVIVP